MRLNRITQTFFCHAYNKLNVARRMLWRDFASLAMVAVFIGACVPLGLAELPSITLLWLILVFAVIAGVWLKICQVLIFLIIGCFWTTYAFEQYIAQPFPERYEKVSVQVQGYVRGLPEIKGGNVRFHIMVDRADTLDGETDTLSAIIGTPLRLNCYQCPYEILPDQYWRLTVRLKRPHGYASWGAFDYEKYLFRHQIKATGYIRVKELNERLDESKKTANTWRWRIRQQLSYLNEPDSVGVNIIMALTIGDKSGFSRQQRQVFQKSGISHLIAISGLHVGLAFAVTAFLFSWVLRPAAALFERVPRQHMVLLPALLGALTYSALAGFAVSTQRAFIMLCVYTVCRLLVRSVSLLKVLLITVMIVLLYDPFSILDIGFWLSCAAVLIIAITGNHNHQVERKTTSLIMLQSFIWLGMLPFTAFFFGQVSIISPLINLIAVPLFCLCLIPLTLLAVLLMQLGLVGLSGWLLDKLRLLFDWFYLILQKVTDLPMLDWPVMPTSVLTVLLGLVLMIVCILKLRYAFLIWSALGASVLYSSPAKVGEDLYVTLLDVGQGLAMVVELDGYVLVYDTGPSYRSGFAAADAVLIPYLRYRGIHKIDTLIISHADNDHIGGYEAITAAIDVNGVLTSRPDVLPAAKACYAGQTWMHKQTTFKIVSPETMTPSGSNNRSCVLRISHDGINVLITGDIEKKVERYLLNSQPLLTADVLLVPHQGSKTSSTAMFLDAVKPKLGLIAAGYKNHYGHPHSEVVERYKQRNIDLLSTIDSGSIQLTISRGDWETQRFRKSEKHFWHIEKSAKKLK